MTTRAIRRSLLLVLLLVLVLTNLDLVQAARADSPSPEFGFGAILYPHGPYLQSALDMATDLGLNWILVPITWSDYQSSAAAAPRLQSLDQIMQFAADHQIAVLVSVSGAPAWAQTAQGPDADMTAKFVSILYQRYPIAIQSFELFPRANTIAGWGKPANPKAYASLLKRVAEQLARQRAQVRLAAAGLEPLGAKPSKGDMDDLAFLKSLYGQGIKNLVPIISIQYTDLASDPLVFPDGSEHRVLRHYEEVRQVMVANNHQTGVIWITHLSQPSGTIKVSDFAYKDINAQANWMSQVNIQMRSQLYVGVNMGQSLNPGPEGQAASVPSLLLGEGKYHPFYTMLREMIGLNKTGSNDIMPGKPKEGNLAKKRP